jgi:hypothetical protein
MDSTGAEELVSVLVLEALADEAPAFMSRPVPRKLFSTVGSLPSTTVSLVAR